jgi:phosphatidate cytidylyltransferase
MKRVLTAAILAPLILAVVFMAPAWLLFAVTAAVAVLCFREYCGIAAGYGVDRLGPTGYAAGLLLMLLHEHAGLLITVFALLALALSMRSGDLRRALPRPAALLLGVVYIFGCWRFALLLRPISPHWLVFALALNWIGDGCAYYAGRTLGRHKLAPAISPAKTWEGSLASVAGSVVFGVLYLGRVLPAVPMAYVVALSVAANLAGQLGDLAESALKRGAGLKDSGDLLPGHGGMLDRVDSTLFALPVVYLFTLLPL